MKSILYSINMSKSTTGKQYDIFPHGVRTGAETTLSPQGNTGASTVNMKDVMCEPRSQ